MTEPDSTPTQKVHHHLKAVQITGKSAQTECDCGWKSRVYKAKHAEAAARSEFDAHQEDANGSD